MKIPFSQLKPQPSFSLHLTPDPVQENFRRQVKEAHFSFVETKKPPHPEWVHFSTELANELHLESDQNSTTLDLLSGKIPFPGFKPYAMAYGGHQFGHWAGQLGDGRAINILETQINQQPWVFQLKGSGPTPYSRSADGLAVLRSSVREYLCSEAMFHLGVPTTRALSLVKTGEWVTRDVLYNGNKADENGAIVCRVSPSFVRFGSFEILSAREEIDALKDLADFTIQQHFPHLGTPSKEIYLQFFQEVVDKTLEMIIHWQRVGFVHGVMNTDNMSILGLTIDYGPYGWLENYDGGWTPNTTDSENKRYRFENQPNVALWNLVQLANALYPLIEEVKPLEQTLDRFKLNYEMKYHEMMCTKLGLLKFSEIPDDFIDELKTLMTHNQIDMTIFFRNNAQVAGKEFDSFWSFLIKSSYLKADELNNKKNDWSAWYAKYQLFWRQEIHDENKRREIMNQTNPKYVLRNYMAQLAIEEAEAGKYELIDELYNLLKHPYEEQSHMEKWFVLRPEWAKTKIGCSMLSCSS